jgi:ABC-2 type transport system ATP-binding protein
MTALARATEVTKRFGSFTAVADTSLQIEPGEIVGLIGANGAGKTTLIRMLLGLLTATAGQVELFGTAPSRQSRSRLGYVSQGLGLYTDLTVDENVQFAATAFAMSPRDIPLSASLHEVRAQPVGEIGLGRQRQLAFACALGHRPELLVLDEPTSGVDALARARLWDTIHEQAEQEIGVLVTTHYMQEAQQCDRLVIMALGRVVAAGPLDDIIGPTTAVEVHSDDWADVFTALVDADAAVTLAGRRVRVTGSNVADVGAILARAGMVDVELRDVPSTLDEVMLTITRRR